MKSKIIRRMTGMLLAFTLITGTPYIVLADKAEAAFGSESYTPQAGVSFPMGIYIKADEAIGKGQTEVKYDPEMLEYVTGGELVEEGLIRLTYENAVGNQARQDIQFIPKAGGKTEVEIVSAQASGIQGNEMQITNMQKVPVMLPVADTCKLNKLTVNGITVDLEKLEQNQAQIEVSGEVETADIQSEASEGSVVTVEDTALKEGENTLKIRVEDQQGNKAFYQLIVTRQKLQAAQEEEKVDATPVPQKEQKAKDSAKGDNSLRNRLFLIGGIFILLEVVICTILGIRIHQKKKRRRRRRAQQLKKKQMQKKQAEGLTVSKQKKAEEIQAAQDKAMEAAITEIMEEKKQQTEEQEDYEIKVENVTMTFRIIQNAPSSMKEYMIQTLKKETKYRDFSALKNVSFNVKKGEVVGIIGTNGSGKSTILKIISGALRPTSGRVKVDRRKIQLLTLGTGFDFELTGRENVYLNGAIIGYTKEYIDEKYDEIVKFAELEGFMDEKVKNYSSGMVSRLGFAIATMRDTPEILILDEVLSVGDMFFRKKSEARIKEMIHGGSTVLIVSHSMDVIRKNCDKVVWIEKGDLKMVGTPKEVCPAYEKQNG